jgi:hypothetical protein
VLHGRISFALAVPERRLAINISTADDVYFGRGNIFRGLEGGERAEAICFSLTGVWLFGLAFSFISPRFPADHISFRRGKTLHFRPGEAFEPPDYKLQRCCAAP